MTKYVTNVAYGQMARWSQLNDGQHRT